MTQVPLNQLRFTPVSKKYGAVRFISSIIWTVIWAAITLGVVGFTGLYTVSAWFWLIPIVVIALCIVNMCLIPAKVARMGYAEREDDVIIRKGLFFRSLTAVPYGRLQYVSFAEGPVLRAFGLSSISISTAGGGTAASLTGIPKEEAQRLREVLVARSRSRLAGL